MWKNSVQLDKLLMQHNMAHAHCMQDNLGNTHSLTHSLRTLLFRSNSGYVNTHQYYANTYVAHPVGHPEM